MQEVQRRVPGLDRAVAVALDCERSAVGQSGQVGRDLRLAALLLDAHAVRQDVLRKLADGLGDLELVGDQEDVDGAEAGRGVAVGPLALGDSVMVAGRSPFVRTPPSFLRRRPSPSPRGLYRAHRAGWWRFEVVMGAGRWAVS
ncbi:hypothetical protein [Streptomyces sp. NPDC004435]|uniref:hypothetical protein n=1 Tax=Streptomyces sp. NPDC004435 TaxID=3364701 RepID=UPI00368E95F9